jgi:hypothetical protein
MAKVVLATKAGISKEANGWTMAAPEVFQQDPAKAEKMQIRGVGPNAQMQMEATQIRSC